MSTTGKNVDTYNIFSRAIANGYYDRMRDKLFTNPVRYTSALGTWAVNLMVNATIDEMGEDEHGDFSTIRVITESRVAGVFFLTTAHFMKITTERDIYFEIDMRYLDQLMASLKKFYNWAINVVYSLITSTFEGISDYLVYEMFNQLTIWMMGFLMGIYRKTAEEEFNKIVKSNPRYDVIITHVRNRLNLKEDEFPKLK